MTEAEFVAHMEAELQRLLTAPNEMTVEQSRAAADRGEQWLCDRLAEGMRKLLDAQYKAG
jgi:hypothetical protein